MLKTTLNMTWDVTRRDGRTAYDCEEIITVKGRLLSETEKELVIKTNTERILVQKGSFRYDELPRDERFFILAKRGNDLKLADYV